MITSLGTHHYWPLMISHMTYFFTVLPFFCLEGFVLLVGNLWISGVKVASGTLSMPKSRVLASTNFLVDTVFSLETASIRENIQNCFKNKCIWWWCISCNFLPSLFGHILCVYGDLPTCAGKTSRTNCSFSCGLSARSTIFALLYLSSNFLFF